MKHRCKKAEDRFGFRVLVIAALVVFATGLVLTIWPVGFDSPGGLGRRARHPVNFRYEDSTSRGVGVFFILISVFLAELARRFRKS